MRLLRSLRHSFSGSQTSYLQQKMRGFIPIDQHRIHDVLTQFYARREYLPFHTPSFSVFISSIEGYYVRQRYFDRKSLRNYQLMQKMQMMTDNTKRIFHENVTKSISDRFASIWPMKKLNRKSKIKGLSIFCGGCTGINLDQCREFPYQFGKFEQIASNYTVRLYDIFEYMNTIDKIPAWEPYIRVSHMLKSLGHDPQCRADMFSLQTLEKIDRKYLLYLSQLFTPQMYPDFVKSLKIHTQLPQLLCQNYIIGDEIEFDKYLQRIQIIDNISVNQEVNCTMDSISWKDFTEAWKLAALSYTEKCLTEIHQHKFCEILWRKLQSSDIPVQDITTLLKLLVDHPKLFFEKRQSIIMRIIESLYEKKDEQIQFFVSTGYKQLLKICEFLPIDGPSIKKLSSFLYEKITALLTWIEGDAQQMLQIIQKKDFPQKNKVIEFLNKKISEEK